jgi:AraC-like DNA-binding protein
MIRYVISPGEFHYLPVGNRDLRREIYVSSVGQLTYSPGDNYPVDGHPEEFSFTWDRGRALSNFTIVLVEAGEGEVEILDSPLQRWLPGQFLWLPPGTWHRYRPVCDTGWTESWLCLNGDYISRLYTRGWFPSKAGLHHLHRSDAFAAALSRIADGAAANSLRVAACAMEALAIALEGTDAAPALEDQMVPTDSLVGRAVHFIEHNCHRPIDVSHVAGHVGVTRRTLERHFCAKWTRSVATEIETVRVARARQLLLETTLSIKEIGYMAGFGGPDRLILAFKRNAGLTPGQYRESEIGSMERSRVRGFSRAISPANQSSGS